MNFKNRALKNAFTKIFAFGFILPSEEQNEKRAKASFTFCPSEDKRAEYSAADSVSKSVSHFLIPRRLLWGVFIFIFTFIIARGQPAGLPAQTGNELPHFFPVGVKEAKTPFEQWKAYLELYNVTRSKLADSKGSKFMARGITVEKTYYGRKLNIVFDQYVREGKDKILYTSFNDQYYITNKQFKIVEELADEYMKGAIVLDFNAWGSVEQKAEAKAAATDGKQEKEFREYLDKEDPVNPGITFRELRFIPEKLEEKDFVPLREIHIGFCPDWPSVLGVAWLNVGIVYYTPVAMIRDYITRSPIILAHELVHTNKKLQSMPLVWGFDAETFASWPDMFVDVSYLDFWFHGYADIWREISEPFFGFKWDQAGKEVVKYDLMGNLVVDEKKFNELSAQMDLIKKEINTVIFPEIVARFYQDPIFATALNDKLVDDNSLFWIVTSMLYNPTLLGGEENTMKFVKKNEPVIRAVADKALEESGKPETTQESDFNSDSLPFTLLESIRNKYGITNEQIQAFLKLYKVSSAKELFAIWEPKEMRKAIEEFIAKERLKRSLQ